MYAGVKYRANGTLQQQRAEANVPVTFIAPAEIFNDTETAIYGASEISSLGDLAPLYCGSVNVSDATKLIELKIGDGTEGYINTNLKDLSVGTNKLLKKIDIQNCPNLTNSLGLSNCPNIEEIYANGSGITGIELSKSGYLRIIQLPATIANLTLTNQLYIEQLTLEGYDAIKTIHIENCPTIDSRNIIESSPNLERLRITNVNWTCPDTEFLKSLYTIGGIDENGLNTNVAYITGTCHINTLTGSEMLDIKNHFPYLNITYNNLTANIVYMSEDGSTELYRDTIVNGGNAIDPIAEGIVDTPTKEADAQYYYTYGGWSLKSGEIPNENALKNVTTDRIVYIAFNRTIRSYTIRFYNGTTLLQTLSVNYGSDDILVDTNITDADGNVIETLPENEIKFGLGSGIHTFKKFSGTGNILISSITITPVTSVGINNVKGENTVVKTAKMIKNNRIVIVKNGVNYSVTGAQLK